MVDIPKDQVCFVSDFKEFLATSFHGEVNSICFNRTLDGNFKEIVDKVDSDENITILTEDILNELHLSDQGHQAREILLMDLKTLQDHGSSPTLNVIKCYEKDDLFPFLPTDVYSFHVDSSPVPTDTILCTYFGESSEILPNSQAIQKVLIPEIRAELKKLHDGDEKEFDSFLNEYFFDLHYQAKTHSIPITLGLGNFWRLAVKHPASPVLPCIHRAPLENKGEKRLLMIC